MAKRIWWCSASQANQFKELEKDNSRLKKLVADLSLDNAILNEALGGNRPGGKRKVVRPLVEALDGFKAQSLSGDWTTLIDPTASQTSSR